MRFLLVDSILQWELGRQAKGVKNVTLSEDFFDDHFPLKPIMPGVLIVEGMAQLSGLLLEETMKQKGVIVKALMSMLDKAKFRQPVYPGSQLEYTCDILQINEFGGKVAAAASVNNEIVAECGLLFPSMPLATPRRTPFGNASSTHGWTMRSDDTHSCFAVRVTGSGVVTCLGNSRRETLNAIARGERVHGGPIPFLVDSPYAAYKAAGEICPDVSRHVADRRMRKFMSQHAELTAVAARQALEEAKPVERGIAPERIGLYAGVGLAAVNIKSSMDFLRNSVDSQGTFSQAAFAKDGLRAIHPLWSFHTLANMPACIVSVLEQIKGDNGIYTPWEDQTALALVEAVHALYRNDIDCAVVVASDTPEHPATLVELAAAGYLDEEDVAAPGAACLVLERMDGPAAFTLQNIHLALETDATPYDPLSPLIGRTIAAAPLLLVALAPYISVHRNLTGCGGHTFFFEVA